jgi:prolyl-tRNA editing enzyme YbaK/EbsC (Cys-tRNA(Pro) deacylase)
MQPLTPENVQAALDKLGLGIQIRFFDTPTATSQQAADNIGCELGQIIKSICFMVDDQPVMVLASGDQKVDDRKLAEFYSVSRKKVKVATPEQLVEIWGYEAGSVPPFAHRSRIPTYIDSTLRRFDDLYAAGGAHNAIFKITLDQLIAATGGEIRFVVKPDTGYGGFEVTKAPSEA